MYCFWRFSLGLFTAIKDTVFYDGNAERGQGNVLISDSYAKISQGRSKKKFKIFFYYPWSAEKLRSVDDQKLKIN